MLSAAVEREAQRLVQPYLNDVAWPTVYLGLACIASFLGISYLAIAGIIPLWLGLILNSFILYADQTPLHEAVHGNIAGKHKNYMWLNHLIGFLCGAVLLHEYKMFRAMHTMHHRDTNNPEFDPDVWVFAKTPVGVFFKCLTIPLQYHYYFFKNIFLAEEYRKEVIHIVLVYLALYSIMIWGVVSGYHWEVLALWYIPYFFASGLIIYFFGYLVHPKEQGEERFKNTRIYFFKGRYAPVINLLWFFQTFHLIHHLYPRIPFYKYPAVFRHLHPILQHAGSHILEYGAEEPSLDDTQTASVRN